MATAKTVEIPVIWLQCATCTGCSVSVLNSVSPTIKNVLVDAVIPGKQVNLRFRATVMSGAGDAVIEEMESTAQREEKQTHHSSRDSNIHQRKMWTLERTKKEASVR